MATVLNESFATSTALSFSSSSWTQATVLTCNSGTVQGLSTIPYDIMTTITFGAPTGGSTIGAQKAVNAWAIPSEDGVTYPISSNFNNYTGSANSAASLVSPTNWLGPFVINVSSAGQQIAVIPSMSNVIGSRALPRTFGWALENQTNITLGSANATYTAITFQNV